MHKQNNYATWFTGCSAEIVVMLFLTQQGPRIHHIFIPICPLTFFNTVLLNTLILFYYLFIIMMMYYTQCANAFTCQTQKECHKKWLSEDFLVQNKCKYVTTGCSALLHHSAFDFTLANEYVPNVVCWNCSNSCINDCRQCTLWHTNKWSLYIPVGGQLQAGTHPPQTSTPSLTADSHAHV